MSLEVQQLPHAKALRDHSIHSRFPEQPLQLSGQDGNYDGFRQQRSNCGDGAEPLADGSQQSHPALHQHNICLGWEGLGTRGAKAAFPPGPFG